MNSLNVVALTLPASWASFLMYDDATNMTDDNEIDIVASILSDYQVERNPLSVEEYGFLWRHGATDYGIEAADCAFYVFRNRS